MNTKPPSPFPEDEIAKWFPWTTVSPEACAARRSHRIGEFSLDEYSYANRKLEAWLTEFGSIIKSAERMEECRRKHLSESERAAVNREITETEIEDQA